jgi:hypothetical protein
VLPTVEYSRLPEPRRKPCTLDEARQMPGRELAEEIRRGGRFVIYYYCISIIVMSFRRTSTVYFVPAQASGVGPGLKFVLLSVLLGWWGVPWGPIFTVQSLWTNLGGGKDVTSDVFRPSTADR